MFTVFTVSTVDATCGNVDGSASINLSDVSSTYTYQWSAGGTSQTISGLGAGVYTVTVTSSNGCLEERVIVINDVGAASITASISDVTCNALCDVRLHLLLVEEQLHILLITEYFLYRI